MLIQWWEEVMKYGYTENLMRLLRDRPTEVVNRLIIDSYESAEEVEHIMQEVLYAVKEESITELALCSVGDERGRDFVPVLFSIPVSVGKRGELLYTPAETRIGVSGRLNHSEFTDFSEYLGSKGIYVVKVNTEELTNVSLNYIIKAQRVFEGR